MPHVRDKEHASKRHVVLAGSLAGLFSRFVIAPLDVVKIRLQLQPHTPGTPPAYRGVLPTMRKIALEEGLVALWKGNIPAELLYLTYGAAQFLAYRQAAALLSRLSLDVPDAAKSTVAGAAAGATATTVTYPLDLLRTRFAAQGGEKVYDSLWHSVRHIAQHEGLRGYFRGLSSAVTQIVPYMGMFFGAYESTRTSLVALDAVPLGWTDALSGGLAAVMAKTGVFPLDLIRKRLQVQGPTREKYVHRNIPVYAGMSRTGRDIFVAEGARGLYRGLTVSLVKAAPLSAITMWSFEKSLRFLEWVDPPPEPPA